MKNATLSTEVSTAALEGAYMTVDAKENGSHDNQSGANLKGNLKIKKHLHIQINLVQLGSRRGHDLKQSPLS